jgi:predicted nucleotidyltransferase component of viral defense system
MLYGNKTLFERTIRLLSEELQFQADFLEKDYYLTLILSKIESLSPNLVFKGGTCLNKIYFDYHRLSEDLDFTLMYRMPTKEEKKAGIFPRKVILRQIEADIPSFVEQLSLKFISLTKRDGSRQHNYVFSYNSVITNKEEHIKLEIRARENNLISKPNIEEVKHKFIDSFTNKSLIGFPKVKVYPLKELLADKLAAAINRSKPRDFYDIDYAIGSNFDFNDKEFINLFQKKLKEDRNDTNIAKYQKNLGLSDSIIKELKEKIPIELSFVLTPSRQKNFNLDNALNRINTIMSNMIKLQVGTNI